MRSIASTVMWLLVAAAVGRFAYHDVASLFLLLGLPLLMLRREWRLWPAVVMLAFYLGANHALGPAALVFAEASGQTFGVMAWVYPVVLSLILASPFVLVNPTSRPLVRSVAMVLAIAILSLPPIGFIAWINPALVGAVLFPGTGAAGLALGAMMLGVLLMPVWSKRATTRVRMSFAVLAFGVLVANLVEIHVPPRQMAYGVFAIDTAFQPLVEDRRERIAIIEAMVDPYLDHWVSHVVLPESILPGFSIHDEMLLNGLHLRAERAGVQVLIGVTVPTGDDSWRNGIYSLGAGERGIVAESRIPAPVGNWRLSGGVPFRGLESGRVQLHELDAHVGICYEEMPLWAWRDAWGADVLLGASNNWFVANNPASSYQRTAAAAASRLMRVPLVRAVNE